MVYLLKMVGSFHGELLVITRWYQMIGGKSTIWWLGWSGSKLWISNLVPKELRRVSQPHDGSMKLRKLRLHSTYHFFGCFQCCLYLGEWETYILSSWPRCADNLPGLLSMKYSPIWPSTHKGFGACVKHRNRARKRGLWDVRWMWTHACKYINISYDYDLTYLYTDLRPNQHVSCLGWIHIFS